MIQKITKKIALRIEYDGTFYHGWQYQKEVSSVQEEIERALSIIANHKINIICAGRTDKGVHSTGQVIHFITTSIRTKNAWIIGVNSYLSQYISVTWADEVSDKFHARYSAISRSYRYIIYNCDVRSALLYNRVNHIYKKLDVQKMHNAAQYLLGEHDFTSFRAYNCQSISPCRNIITLNVHRYENWVLIDIKANSFLYHMVRNIVGSLIEVGYSNKEENWIEILLKKKNRKYAGATAPSGGLYLVFVEYPIHFNLPTLPFYPIFFK